MNLSHDLLANEPHWIKSYNLRIDGFLKNKDHQAEGEKNGMLGLEKERA